MPVGLAARDTLRLEAGMPLYGNELTGLTRPQQAASAGSSGREKTADYVGRESVESYDPAGQRVLVGLVSEGAAPAATATRSAPATTWSAR